MAMKKKKDFPNNWEALKDAPSEYFEPIAFDDFMDWKVGGWEIPSSVACIIRATNLDTKQVKEMVYERKHAARKKVMKMMDEGNYEFYIVDEETIHYLFPKYDDDTETD